MACEDMELLELMHSGAGRALKPSRERTAHKIHPSHSWESLIVWFIHSWLSDTASYGHSPRATTVSVSHLLWYLKLRLLLPQLPAR